MIRKNFDLLVTLFKTEGPVEVVRRLAFRFFHVHTFVVMRLRLSERLPEGRIPEGVDFREVNTHELGLLRAGRDDLPEYFFRDESETNLDRCWVGVQDGRLGFITWISRRGSSGFVVVGETEMELAFIYSLEEMRGKRMTTNAVFLIGHVLRTEGTTALWAVPHSGNPAIVKSFEASGFARVGIIKRFGFVTWPRTPVDYGKMQDVV
jgi:RimJ/RimL family protein N-acetyltransferase